MQEAYPLQRTGARTIADLQAKTTQNKTNRQDIDPNLTSLQKFTQNGQ